MEILTQNVQLCCSLCSDGAQEDVSVNHTSEVDSSRRNLWSLRLSVTSADIDRQLSGPHVPICLLGSGRHDSGVRQGRGNYYLLLTMKASPCLG